MIRKFRFILVAAMIGCLTLFTKAGIITWLFGPSPEERYQRDTGTDITAHACATIAGLIQKASVEQKPAIQVGEIHSSIAAEAVDDRWFGDVKVRLKADYSATYGMPYDLIAKGIRIEKDYSTNGLLVMVSAPVPLSVAVDTRSVYVEHREKSGIRTWSKASKLQIEAQKWLTERASDDAQHRCSESDALEVSRSVVLDFVLDMVGDLYSKKMKRALTPHTRVIFEHEFYLEYSRRRIEPSPQSG